MTTKYRADIDGLRAVSILAVMCFHFGLPAFGGGYVGVSLFFVISGYVITLSLLGDLETGKFSILAFYERRVRRIFPALIFTFILCWLAAWLLFLPADFLDFSNGLLSSATFVSNIYFWRSSGYFDTLAHLRPLLHTWSLSVEEQFYVFMPIAVYLTHRFLKARWLLALVPVLLASFALSAFATYTAPMANFFVLPTRAWELLLGALLAFAHLPAARGRIAEALALCGAALIAFAIVAYSDATPFPGVSALAPCVGAALLIYAGTHAPTSVGRLLTLPPMVFIGKISYSLYLVHWPIIVFTRHATLREPTDLQIVLIAVVSFALATFSWAVIERPFRWPKKRIPRARLLFGGAGAMALAALVGVAGLLLHGMPGRFSGPVQQAQIEQATWMTGVCFLLGDPDYRAWNADRCRRTSGHRENALLWGDSFAAHYAPGLIANADNLTANVFQYTAAGCPPVLSHYSYALPNCQKFNAHVLEIIRRYDIKTVVIAARWRGMPAVRLRGLAATIASLKAAGVVDVWVIGQSTEFLTDVATIAHRNEGNGGADVWQLAFDRGFNEKVRQAAAGATFVDPLSYLCSGDECLYRSGGDLIYFDYGHFSAPGSARAVLAYFPLMRRKRAQ
jgi:peptidoglycan/LPS O-acetylase OafA/YrhL